MYPDLPYVFQMLETSTHYLVKRIMEKEID